MVIPEFIITCWVLVLLGNFLRHISVRSVLTSVYSVSNCIFRVYSVGSVGNNSVVKKVSPHWFPFVVDRYSERKRSSLLTRLAAATARRMAWKVPSRNGLWSGMDRRCGWGVSVWRMMWLPT